MQRSPVYKKTALGSGVLHASRGTLSSPARRLLILIDGHRDLSELSAMLGADTVRRWLPGLTDDGYVRPVPPGQPPPEPAPAARSGIAHRDATAVAKPAPKRLANQRAGPIATRVRTGWVPGAGAATRLALVGAVVLGIWWWYKQTSPTPEPPVAPELPAPSRLLRRAAEPLAAALPAPPLAQRKTDVQGALKAHAAPRGAPDVSAESHDRGGAAAAPGAASASASSEPRIVVTVPFGAPTSLRLESAEVPDLAADTPGGAAGRSPVLRNRVLPDLSARARRAGIVHGQVLVRLHVNSAGTVDLVELIRADPPQLYDTQVERALEAWTFAPPGRSWQETVVLNFQP
jgi:protein TonB